MTKKYLSPFIFFFIKEGRLVVWDYKNHQQFEIESKYFERLFAISNGDECDSEIDVELLEAKLISFSNKDIEWGWDLLSKIFHIGIQNVSFSHDISNDQQHLKDYMNYCGDIFSDIPNMVTEKNGEKFKLPSPDLSIFSKNDFLSVLRNRKTSRSFNGNSISLGAISSLLYAVFGNMHQEWLDLKEYNLSEISFRKSSPSAGGVHPAEAYLLVMNVDGLSCGVYHYESHSHILTLINTIDCNFDIGRLLLGQTFAKRLSIGVFISARLEKNWHKYKHSRGYTHVLFDIGHLSQTFQLCATAMGLNPWLTAAFLDDEVARLLKIEETTEYPMFFVGAGFGDGHSLSQEMRSYLQEVK